MSEVNSYESGIILWALATLAYHLVDFLTNICNLLHLILVVINANIYKELSMFNP